MKQPKQVLFFPHGVLLDADLKKLSEDHYVVIICSYANLCNALNALKLYVTEEEQTP